MPAVSQEDMDRANAIADDARDIYVNGTTVGTPTIPVQFTGAEYDAFSGGLRQFFKAQAISLLRIFKNGPVKFPAQLPSYAVADVPSAAANTGCLIFVTNDVGGAVPAFSDGSTWRRVTDRAPIAV
jgi:hypothetical protein